jgi:hypothetical protein
MKTRILPTIVLVFFMLGCGEDRDPEGSDGGSRPAERATTATRPSKPTKVLVTSADASLPDGCHPRQIAGLVIDFIDAFNSGDQERLARLFFSYPKVPVLQISRRKGTIRGPGTR